MHFFCRHSHLYSYLSIYLLQNNNVVVDIDGIPSFLNYDFFVNFTKMNISQYLSPMRPSPTPTI